MKRAVRVGVTGKLGSGKSTLLRVLTECGLIVLNTDQMARDAMEDDATLRQQVIALAGAEVYNDGKLNRQRLATKIFSDEELRSRLEAVVHPAVTQMIESSFRVAPPDKPVIVESALLLSHDLRKHFDYLVLVDAHDDAVLDRVRQFGALTVEDAQSRLAAQDYEHANYDEVDITVENTGTLQEFEARAKTLAQMLLALANRDMPTEPLHASTFDEA